MKAYTLTDIEMEVIRNALIDYYFETKNLKPNSPHIKKVLNAVKGLKDQFKTDVANLK